MKSIALPLITLSLLLACQSNTPVLAPISPSSTSSPDLIVRPTPQAPLPSSSPSAIPTSVPTASPSASLSPTSEPVLQLKYKGVVFSNENTPLAGAKVTFLPDISFSNLQNAGVSPEFVTETNDLGEYELEIPAGLIAAMEVRVEKEGHITRRKFFRERSCCGFTLLDSKRSIIPLSLQEKSQNNLLDFGRTPQGVFTPESMLIASDKSPLRSLIGKVTNIKGEVIPSAILRLETPEGDLVDMTHTLHQGDFLFSELKPGQKYILKLSKPGYTLGVSQTIDFKADSPELKLQLDTVHWQGVIQSSEGKPIENAKLAILGVDSANSVNLNLVTLANGQFSFHVPPNIDLKLTATNGTEILKTTLKSQAPGESSAPLLLSLLALQWDGVVYDSLNRPVPNAEVWAKSLDASKEFEQKVKTDGEGKYTIQAPILDTQIELIASHPNYMAKKIRRSESSFDSSVVQSFAFGTDDETTALIPLDQLKQSLTSISGTVKTAFGVAKGATLLIKNSKGFEDTTITGADGSYLFPSLKAGVDTYTLTVLYKSNKQVHSLPIDTQKRRLTDLDFAF